MLLQASIGTEPVTSEHQHTSPLRVGQLGLGQQHLLELAHGLGAEQVAGEFQLSRRQQVLAALLGELGGDDLGETPQLSQQRASTGGNRP